MDDLTVVFVFVFVGCLTSHEHAKCASGINLLRQVLHAAMLRQKLRVKLSLTPSQETDSGLPMIPLALCKAST